MPAGRPTKYTPELLEKAHQYLKDWNNEINGLTDVIPSHVGLASYLGISTACMYDWASQQTKKEFSDILSDIMSAQQRILISKGLSNQFNANIAKLVLGKHGYHDRQDQHISGGDKPVELKWTTEVVSPTPKEKDAEK